jgi:hypothetical protein
MEWLDLDYRGFFPLFEQFLHLRVLFAGNGISVLPHMFAHFGFDCTAADISTVATEYARTPPPEVPYGIRFIAPFPIVSPPQWSYPGPRAAFRASRRPSGQVRFLRST